MTKSAPTGGREGFTAANAEPRCLMVACGSVLGDDGYATRVWMALRAVVEVQRPAGTAPVLLAFESPRSLANRAKVAAARERAAANGCVLWVAPGLPKSLPFQFALNRLWAGWIVRYAIWRTGARIVHAQSHVAAAAVATALAGRPRVGMVFDVHGVDIEERIADGRMKGNTELRQRLEAQADALARADHLIVVTKALGDHIRAVALTAGRECHARTHLVPCVLSLPPTSTDHIQLRVQARARLGFGDAPCVLYLGSSSAWQQPRLIIEVFAALRTRIPSARLLIVTGDPFGFAALAREGKLDPESHAIVSVPHREVQGVAAAADVALLLREDTVVNRVSSPTKFAEYLSLGIPVVVTEVLGDFAALVRSADVGAVVPSDAGVGRIADAVWDLLTADEAAAASRRRRCIDVVRQHLSFESLLPTYRTVYGRAGESAAGDP